VTRTTLILRYSLFAVIATVANLGSQRAVLWMGESMPYYIAAVITGTLLGLITKYVLDKRWIFADPSTGLKAHSRMFTLYTIMGGVTTALFWGFETAFWLTFHTHTAREIGAVLGLAIGYAVKYQLDRRFVFNTVEHI
jgi:putative flippase GtrA